ncbi:MAG: CHAP domain-containing protein [Tessaracoccus sp.]|uniref:CHAP domain-containing protein n=1 Tax=Tessaracoccus sp. TaxID=1971211 RepID=UPI001EB30B06|nr:CHAP domain-containing protein [Tessaracoccus sp.]MBK7821191.1 CHAP domain-containing protein [Tessaracoccus sp.]
MVKVDDVAVEGQRRAVASRWVAVWVALALAVVGSIAVPTPARADSPPFSHCYATRNQSCVSQWGYTGQRAWNYPVDAYGNNCTNYAAFRLSANGFQNPGNLGDASNWATNARAKGLHVFAGSGNSPRVGDVAQWNYGHVAYVEWVSADGSQFAISETGYEWNGYVSMSGRGIFGGGGKRNQAAWPDNFIRFNGGSVPSPSGQEGRPYYLSAVKSSGEAFAKSGMHGEWVKETSSVIQTAVASDPVNGLFYGALASDGTLRGKQGLHGGWTTLSSGVKQFSIASDSVNGLFVAIVKEKDGVVYGKQGMHGGWTRLTDGAEQVAISSDAKNGLFVGVLYGDGVVRGKQGMNGEWTKLTSGVKQIAVTSDPANGVFYATLHGNGVVLGKQGMHGGWTTLTEGAKQVAIASDSRNGLFVGQVNSAGVVYGKQGMNGAWTRLTDGAQQVSVSSDPAGGVFYVTLHGDGVVNGKQGMHGGWTRLTSGALQVALPGDSSGRPVKLPLTASPAPQISGVAQVGKTLAVNSGEWKPAPVTLAYQWLRDGKTISGATKASYTLTSEDVGAKVSVKVTGAKAGYVTVSKTSAQTAAVSAAPSPSPEPTTPSVKKLTATPVPVITGSVKVGKKLTAAAGEWKPSGVVLSYQWYRSGKKIAKATGQTYKLTAADKGATISVKVSGRKSGYITVTKMSAVTKKVKAGTLSATPKPKISGTAKVGKKLTVKAGVWKPVTVKLSYRWLRNGKAVKGATKSTYKLKKADKGKKITVKVTGKKSGYTTASKVSAATRKVA